MNNLLALLGASLVVAGFMLLVASVNWKFALAIALIWVGKFLYTTY